MIGKLIMWVPTSGTSSILSSGFSTRKSIPYINWKPKPFSLFWSGTITISNFSHNTCIEMYEWMDENLQSKFKVYNWLYTQISKHGRYIKDKHELGDGPMIIYLRSKDDAMAFKLRWF